MDKIQMMGKLVIKQVVTDGYKQKAGQQFQTEIDKVDSDIAVYDENMQKAITKLTLKGDPNVEMYRRQFMAEKEKLAAYKEQLKLSLQAVMDLPDGEIVETGEGNFLQEVKVGEPFTANVSCEIILKDDIVMAINPQE
ncbi:MAG: YlqD family protein [Peptococcaceae bacterium]